MRKILKLVRNVSRNTKGATAIEYGLIAALISIAAVTSMGTLGSKVSTTFVKIATSI